MSLIQDGFYSVFSEYSESIDDIEDGGRIPTPQWKTKEKAKKKSRHHLDLTTPAVGGALLSSPPVKSKPRGKRPKSSIVSKSVPLNLQGILDQLNYIKVNYCENFF